MSYYAYDAVALNMEPVSYDMYSRITDNVLARLLIRQKKYHHTFWIDDEGSYRIVETQQAHDILNLVAHALVIYGHDDEFVVVDFTDGPSVAIQASFEAKFKGAMISQFSDYQFLKLVDRTTVLDTSKFVRGFFTRNDFSYPTDDPAARYCNSSFIPLPPYTGTIDKLIFAGTLHEHTPERHVLKHFRDHPDVQFYEGSISPNGLNHRVIDKQELWKEYAQHRGMLALRGTSGFCFREFDALCGGYPLFMPPWLYETRMEPLIDNVHYFAVEFDSNSEVFAQRILDRFYQVRGDEALLTKVRLGGQEWFRQNAEVPHIANTIVQWIQSTLRPKKIRT